MSKAKLLYHRSVKDTLHFRAPTDLFGSSREFHNMERLVIGGGTLVDIDNQGSSSLSTENSLEELGEFALSERNVAVFHPDQQTQEKQKCKNTFK